MNLVDPRTPTRVVITTPRHACGYNLSAFSVTVSSVYLSGQNTRDQLDDRTRRIGQTAPLLTYIVVECDILSNIRERYDRVGARAAAVRGLATEVSIAPLPHV